VRRTDSTPESLEELADESPGLHGAEPGLDVEPIEVLVPLAG
jgi:hypothetical protein